MGAKAIKLAIFLNLIFAFVFILLNLSCFVLIIIFTIIVIARTCSGQAR